MLEALKKVFTKDYWIGSAKGIARTAVAAFVPTLLVIASGGTVDWAFVGLAFPLTVVAAILTALAGVPEDITDNPVLIIVFRVIRQMAQFMGASLATAILITDVAWPALLLQALASGVATMFIATLGLKGFEKAPTTA